MMKRNLGTFERALLISDNYSPFNIVCVMHLEGSLPGHILEQALCLLQTRHPLLRSRIDLSGGRPCFTEIIGKDIPLQVIDRQAEDQWMDIVERELNQRFDIASGPLTRCHYLSAGSKGSSRCDLIMTFHHTIADAASIMHLLTELLQTCEAIQLGGDTHPLPALPINPPIEELFPPDYQGTRRLWRILGYVLRQGVDEMRYRWLVRGKRMPPVLAAGRACILVMQTPQATLRALVQRARLEKVTLNSVLNAAMMVTLNRHLYAGEITPMRTFSFADLRPYAVPPLSSENLSSAISMLRYTVLVDPDRDLWSLARDLQTQIYRSLKSGDKYIASLMSEGLMKMIIRLRAFRMGATGLSYSGPLELPAKGGLYKVLGLHGFVSNIDLGPEFSAMVSLFNDELSWGMVYMDGDMDRSRAQSIAGKIQRILETAL